MTICTFRFKRQLRRLRDGNSYSERRWNNGGWRRFWSFSLYWTSWVKTMSDRSLNELTPPVCLCSPMTTSLPWMSFISLLGLRGTMTWGMFGFNGASDNKLYFPTWTFTLLCNFQVDRPIRTGIAPLVGTAWRAGQGRGRSNLYGFLDLEVTVQVLQFVFDLRHCFCSRQVPEGHPAQSAAQWLLWQSADSSEWNMPGGRGTGAATCCGWVPGCGAAIRTWYWLHAFACMHTCILCITYICVCVHQKTKIGLSFYILSQEGTASEKYAEPVQVETTEVGSLMCCFINRLHLYAVVASLHQPFSLS